MAARGSAAVAFGIRRLLDQLAQIEAAASAAPATTPRLQGRRRRPRRLPLRRLQGASSATRPGRRPAATYTTRTASSPDSIPKILVVHRLRRD